MKIRAFRRFCCFWGQPRRRRGPNDQRLNGQRRGWSGQGSSDRGLSGQGLNDQNPFIPPNYGIYGAIIQSSGQGLNYQNPFTSPNYGIDSAKVQSSSQGYPSIDSTKMQSSGQGYPINSTKIQSFPLNNGFGSTQVQEFMVLDMYDVTVVCDNLLDTFLWLEKFVEVAYGHVIGWDNNRQMGRSEIMRPDIDTFDAERTKKVFGTQLRCLMISIKELEIPSDEKLRWLQENFQPQFYKWVDASGIEVGNKLTLDLAELLVSINKVLKGERKIEFLTNLSKRTSAAINNMSDVQLSKVVSDTISGYQDLVDSEIYKAESLQGQHSTEQTIANKFSFLTGNVDKGKKKLDLIEQDYIRYLRNFQQNLC
ncbi:hypothetical protein C1645_748658 [Glomus cerebriforme]|uniref:Uncharacterized protein n=1 Tax=Glomus cerebriforme TaxID=658196 RepID=A0A397TVH5_9GLOM|nr:hypothetical protein C1645_748658 [Glomus cerebriforme]